MADKQGVLIYYKYRKLLEKLPREIQGDIFMASLLYDETGEISEFEDPAAQMLFSMMILDFDALRKSWDETCKKNSDNGKKGGRPKNPPVFEETQKTHRFFENPTKPTVTQKSHKDKDNEKDNDQENEKGNDNTALSFSPPPFSKQEALDGITVGKQDLMSWLDENQKHWNNLGLSPPCVRISLSPVEIQDLTPIWRTYSASVTTQAMANYLTVMQDDSTYDMRGCKYNSMFGFLKKGVDKYCDAAKPLEVFMRESSRNQEDEDLRERIRRINEEAERG